MKYGSYCVPVCLLEILFALVAHGQAASQTTKQPADTIVTGMVVTMDARRSIYDDGAVRSSATRSPPSARAPTSKAGSRHGRRSTRRGKLVLPGFINGHTHVPMTLFRGLHDDVTLNDWLYKYIFPAESQERKRRVRPLGHAPGRRRADSLRHHHLRRHVLLRRRRRRRNQKGRHARRAGRNLHRLSRARQQDRTPPCSPTRKSSCRSGKAIR